MVQALAALTFLIEALSILSVTAAQVYVFGINPSLGSLWGGTRIVISGSV